MHNLHVLKEILSTPKKIVIVPHRKPDADALGSSLALSGYLRKLGHQTTVISPTDYPKFLFWMKGNSEVLIYEDGGESKAKKIIEDADVIFVVDFSAISRVEAMAEPLKAQVGKKTFVLIDHHQGKEDFADYELWQVSAAATAELIYDFIVMNGHKHLIDIEIAEAIYAGIMTDTGSFKFASTSSKIHRIAAELKDLGIDSARIHHLVYDTNSENRLKFLGYALNKKLVILPQYKAAYFAITAEELQEFNSQTGDTEGLVNYALSVENIKLAALFIEKRQYTKMSFRSIGKFSVAHLASKYFGGGGHHNAAGGQLPIQLSETVQKFISVLEEFKDQLEEEEF